AGAVEISLKMEDGLIDAVVVAVAGGPVGRTRGAAECPVEELRAVLGGLHQRGSGEDFAHMRREIESGPGGLEVDDGIARSGGHEGSLSITNFLNALLWGRGCRVMGLLKRETPNISYLIRAYYWQCASSRLWKSLAYQGHGFDGGGDEAFKLGVFDGTEHVLELRAWFVSGGNEFAAAEQELGADYLFGRGFIALAHEVVDVEVAVSGQAIHAVQGQVLIEVFEAEEALEGGVFHARGVGEAHVVFDQRQDHAGFFVG